MSQHAQSREIGIKRIPSLRRLTRFEFVSICHSIISQNKAKQPWPKQAKLLSPNLHYHRVWRCMIASPPSNAHAEAVRYHSEWPERLSNYRRHLMQPN
jgi:hypothetical protein